MPAALAKITPGMFPELYDALLRDWNPAISEEIWHRAFESPAADGRDYFGHALTDQGRIVGMLGMIFSQRQIGGNARTFCNLHSWRAKSEYRGRSLLLLRPLQELQDVTCTDLTPTDDVIPIMTRLGISRLDQFATVLPPAPWRGNQGRVSFQELTEPAEHYQGELEAADLQIYADHRGLDCVHLVIRSATQKCYVVVSRLTHRWLSHCYVHHISDGPLFAEHHLGIRSYLTGSSRQSFVVVDSRLLADVRLPYSFRIRSTEKLYRSRDVAPHEIDGLYSEQVILKHSSLPSWRTRLRSKIGQHTPHLVRRLLNAAP